MAGIRASIPHESTRVPAITAAMRLSPTADDARAFVTLINKAREAFDLDPLTRVPYEEAEPGNPVGCLSALTLILPVSELYFGGQGEVLAQEFLVPFDARTKLAEALGTRVNPQE